MMTAACTIFVAMAALGAPGPRADEFICVAPDNWHFVGAQTGRKFVPFGTNFVFADKKYLNLFAPEVYDRRLYKRALAALEAEAQAMAKEGALKDYRFNITATPAEAANGFLNVYVDLVPAFELRRVSLIIGVQMQ